MKFQKYIKDNISFLTVKNNIGFEVTFSTLGASIYSIVFHDKQMTLTPNVKDWKKKNMYHGKTIGRVGNRIRGNVIECEGKKYLLENNEGPNTLHGGINGISTKTFKEYINNIGNYCEITYEYVSSDGESGFPGEINIKCLYRIYENESKLELEFFAASNKCTPCSLTNHSYFNLGDEDENTLKLTIKASKFIVPNKVDLLGEGMAKVPSYLDFRKGKFITKDIYSPALMNYRTKGYDHHFFFDKTSYDFPQVILENTDYVVKIFTDYSGVQFYSDNFVDDIKYLKTSKTIFRGCALEPQESHLKLHYLKPNEQYHHKITYLFDKK